MRSIHTETHKKVFLGSDRWNADVTGSVCRVSLTVAAAGSIWTYLGTSLMGLYQAL